MIFLKKAINTISGSDAKKKPHLNRQANKKQSRRDARGTEGKSYENLNRTKSEIRIEGLDARVADRRGVDPLRHSASLGGQRPPRLEGSDFRFQNTGVGVSRYLLAVVVWEPHTP